MRTAAVQIFAIAPRCMVFPVRKRYRLNDKQSISAEAGLATRRCKRR
jgi:hypothetical protein